MTERRLAWKQPQDNILVRLIITSIIKSYSYNEWDDPGNTIEASIIQSDARLCHLESYNRNLPNNHNRARPEGLGYSRY